MLKVIHNIYKLIFPLLGTLLIGACVSTTDDDTESESRQEAAKKIRANMWLTPDCLQDNSGQYYRGLYKFTDDGEILSGEQGFQDASCSTKTNETTQPRTFSGSYAVLDSETLEDGTDGFSFDYSIETRNILAYFRMTDSETLCFSNNLEFRADVVNIETGSVDPRVDYRNCLTLNRSSDDNDPDPNPNPGPAVNLQGVWVLSTQCRVNDAGNHYYWLVDFTQDNRVLEAYAFFNNTDCSGTTTATDFSDINLTYTDQGEATLPDGRKGHQMRLIQGVNSFDGYYTFDAQNRLCISHSFTLTRTDNDSTELDYNNCFSRPD
ncbi:MAG: hypothetical protein N0C81_12130 [Candidatus Thiodiazotropha lotti]|uniref:Lipoprotein n=1 Tax=Candidatus Thiodiazotropha lotti TaxID=2792787 RepID=A0A9E4K235_9GAMM|nr:hypothetical protein [Candidatus Thiodiazotropha lotti]ODC00632.1 hypothetical protein A3197_09955 [Candidatus Thiodiazotropha endoloripes]MCG7920186.1 hypothetical protein [Candidatus Thiodiazotropha lotti]MCG7928553.1 hypothetical protein [Candidatus Thiodiazotropha lotti]MCG7938196.1 hypothetical protein [Candidatus Thiodiazotropha lotti]